MPSDTRAMGFLRTMLAGATVSIAALAGGCGAPARVVEPLTSGPLAGNDSHQKTEFWYQLARRPAVSNDEAFHALLLYFDGTDPSADYPGRVAALKTRKMLPATFDRPADEIAQRGVVALSIARA